MLINSYFQQDVVNGIIIGGETYKGQLYYEDRAQGQAIYGDSDAEIKAEANQRIEAMKASYGASFPMIYPKSAWTVRIFE